MIQELMELIEDWINANNYKINQQLGHDIEKKLNEIIDKRIREHNTIGEMR